MHFAARYSASGELLWVLSGNVTINALAVQPDGTVLLSGRASSYNSTLQKIEPVLRQGESVFPIEVDAGSAGFTAHVDSDGRVVRYDLIRGMSGSGVICNNANPPNCFESAGAENQYIAAGPSGYATCGIYNGTVEFGSGSDTIELTGYLPPYNAGYHVATYASDGRILSAQRLSNGACHGIASTGVSYAVAGLVHDSWSFGSGDDAITLTTTERSDYFLAGYEASGSVDWVTRIDGGAVLNTYGAVAGMPDGSVVVTGSYKGNAVIGEVPDALGVFAEAGGFAARLATDGMPLEMWNYEYISIDRTPQDPVNVGPPAAQLDGSLIIVGSTTREITLPTRYGTVGQKSFVGNTIFFANYSGVTSGTSIEDDVPSAIGYLIGAPYPNPFEGVTVVPITISTAGTVRMTVYDVLGRELAVLLHGELSAGTHHVRLDATAWSSGPYLVRLEVAGQVLSQMVTLAR